MNITNKLKLYFSLILLVFISQCNNCNHKKIKNIEANAYIFRFDSVLYNLNEPKLVPKGLAYLKDKDSGFYNIYFNQLYSVNPAEKGFESFVYEHVNNTQNQTIKTMVAKEFNNFDEIKRNLDLLSRYYKLYYPQNKFPKINLCYSGLAGFMAWLYNDSAMMVDLDMYLGADFEGYAPYFPKYKSNYYTKDFLVQNIGRELIRRSFLPYEQEKPKNMLSYAILDAAKIIELQKLMPCRPVSKLFEYTPEQWEWALKEEQMIWTYMVKENLLYESEYQKYRPMVGEAPNTIRSGVAEGAPPRIAIFAAYQLLQKFMENKKVENMYEVIEKYSADEILKIAKYKP